MTVGPRTGHTAAVGVRDYQGDPVVRLQRTGEDVPAADVVVDATRPLDEVVDVVVDLVAAVTGPRTDR